MNKRSTERKHSILAQQKKAQKRHRIHKLWLKKKNKYKYQITGKRTLEFKREIHQSYKSGFPVSIKAPAKFSLIYYPNEVLSFFSEAKQYLNKKVEIKLDFTNLEMVTPDALALLLAKFTNVNFTNSMRIYGNKPENPDLDRIFKASGFYRIIGIDKSKSEHGIIETKKNTVVDREIAVEARQLAAKKTFNCDKKLQPVYRTLIECMANTKKHARGENRRDETWWLAVFNDDKTKITSFSFLDTGIGIFKSAKIRSFTKFAQKLGLSNNIDILKDLLAGKVKSSTGLKHRGKGIPKIYNDFKDNHLHRLHIISNDIYANLQDGIFIELKHPLNGTFYYWEVLPPTTIDHGNDN